MKKKWVGLLMAMAAVGMMDDATAANPKVSLNTTMGNIVIELFPEQSPKTVENFLSYVRQGHYGGTIFHRVIRNFMIQGGGMMANMVEKPTRAPVRNEADNGLKNVRGTIAMARTSDPHSATAQFFINTRNNDFLDFTSRDPRGWGYCVFGRVVDGMDVVDKIEKLPTGSQSGHDDVPTQSVSILNAQPL